MALRKGAAELEKSVERSKSRGSGDSNRAPLNFFKWEDKETKFIRFLTDSEDIFLLWTHEYVACHDNRHRTFICRKEEDASCELCDNDVKRRELGYGVAVLREPVQEDGKVVGYQDYIEEYEDEDGDAGVRPYVGIVRQAPGNFWTYITGIHERKGSLRDYDIEITRKGAQMDTIYMAFPCDPVEIEEMDERYAKFTPDLESILEAQVSADYYARHLHGVEPNSNNGSSNNGSGSGSEPPLPQDSDEDELEALRAAQRQLVENKGNPYG